MTLAGTCGRDHREGWVGNRERLSGKWGNGIGWFWQGVGFFAFFAYIRFLMQLGKHGVRFTRQGTGLSLVGGTFVERRQGEVAWYSTTKA